MYEVQEDEYQCPACDRKQPWRPESAGRPVTCACGAVLIVPFAPGAAEARGFAASAAKSEEGTGDQITVIERPEEDEDDEAGEVLLCPDCGANMRHGAIVCPHCGYHRPKPKKRVFRRRAVEDARLKPADEHWLELTVRPFRDRYLPLALAVAGLFVELAVLAHLLGSWRSAMAISPSVLLLAVATIAVILPIALLLTPVLDLSLGPILPLATKLTAAVIFPPAVGVLLWGCCGEKTTGIAIGSFAAMVLYLSLFRLLFEFDWPDSMLLIALVSLAHAVILLALLLPLTYASGHLAAIWPLYEPIATQAALTFLIAGGVVAPHFGEA